MIEEGSPPRPCWICGSEKADTGEHKSKKTDITEVLGRPSPGAPLYVHTSARANRRLTGLKAEILKSKGRICGHCNNERTQPSDYAWEKMAKALRSRDLKPGTKFRATTVFPRDTHRQLLLVHLYFVKAFGCHIVETGADIDVAGFSQAIMSERAHPEVFLQIGRAPLLGGNEMVGLSNLFTRIDVKGRCDLAVWDYYAGNVAISVLYAAGGISRREMRDAWHPSRGTSRFTVIDTGTLRARRENGQTVGLVRAVESRKRPPQGDDLPPRC